MTEPTEKDLLKAVKDSLQNEGRLGRFKAELRTAIMSILNRHPSDKVPPMIPEKTKFINELLREYLLWNGYTYSEQMLTAESCLSKERISRESMATKLGVIDNAHTLKVPLLYYIVGAFNEQEHTQ